MSPRTMQLGVTFHSFTYEYCSFKWSFEDMMRAAADLGGGVEIVGPAHHRGFPDVSDEFERVFKSSVERNELTPTCYGTYADPFMLPDRDLTDDELTDYTMRQLKGAVKLGFPIARLQYFASSIVERVLPFAEKNHLKLAYELHTPLAVESAEAKALIDQIKRIDSAYLGLIPDAGIFARSVPQWLRRGVLDQGVTQPLLALAIELWNNRMPLREAQAKLTSAGASSRQFSVLERIWGSFDHSEPSELKTIMPYVMHVHGKFFSMQDGDEPDVRYKEMVAALIDGAYSGWISSEYEGPDGDSYVLVSEHQKMIKRYAQLYSGPRPNV